MQQDRVLGVVTGVAANFFSTLGIEPVRGRTLADEDVRAAEKRVVISEPLAARLWPGADPIGRAVTFGTDVVVVDGDTTRVPGRAVVVGTVRPIAISQITDPKFEQVFVPAERHVRFATEGVLLRTSGTAAGSLAAIRAEMRRMDGTLPLVGLRALASDVERQLRVQRGLTRMVASFGGLAVVLALVGLYGTVVAGVAARRSEIGVRLALGAKGREVVALFVGGGVRVAAYGILTGAALALAVGRLISSIMWGVRPYEPTVMALTSLMLVLAAAVASWIPARQAARIAPMSVLRDE